MYMRLFSEFLTSSDTLRVYQGNKLLFSSNKDRLIPLLEYIDRYGHNHKPVVLFDKVMGNAAALLSVTAGCREVYSPLGSQLAVKTLDRYGIRYNLTEIAPYIRNPNGEDMCPMEKLSVNKEPKEFYELVRKLSTAR
ncbi:hypothetical protein ES706_02096 [subsurface metagenome]